MNAEHAGVEKDKSVFLIFGHTLTVDPPAIRCSSQYGTSISIGALPLENVTSW